jgi:hypothetical protein
LGKFGTRGDWIWLAVVLAAGFGMAEYRAVYIEPRSWGAVCAAAGAPWACVPRAGLLWLQTKYLFGVISLVLGVGAFLMRGPRWLAAVAMIVGIAGVQNYNATWGMLGAALGAWAWLSEWNDPQAAEVRDSTRFAVRPTR